MEREIELRDQQRLEALDEEVSRLIAAVAKFATEPDKLKAAAGAIKADRKRRQSANPSRD